MAGEAFVMNDGHLSWVAAASANGGWYTAATPASAIDMVFVENFQFNSGQRNYAPIRDRGDIQQVVYMNTDLSTLEFSRFYTGGDGLPTGFIHLEFGALISGVNSAYIQFTHCQKTNLDFTEAQEGDMIREAFNFDQMLVTGSGLLFTV